MTDKELIALAFEACEKAYAPYSGCKVGAALLGKSGKVYTGCNIENSSFGATNCAERTAVFKAVSEGEKEFVKIATAGIKEGESAVFYPCGICRQVLAEFCTEDFPVISAKSEDEYETNTLGDLLKNSFRL
ncbi:MAG: cytidine deaminase [Clostridia bacterium]|jgi:cytidine deaminase|nr:cytidine deaminase [Clostridia bacterium]